MSPLRLVLLTTAFASGLSSLALADPAPLALTSITEWKAVYGTVEARDRIPARARLGGTLVVLSVAEGDVGEIVVTTLDPHHPVVRLALGDLLDQAEPEAHAAGLLHAAPQVSGIGLGPDARPITPNRTAGDGATRFGAVFQYDPAGAFDGHFVATQAPAAIADWKAFLTSMAATGTPTVP